MSAVSTFSAGHAFGYAALFLIGLAAILMLLRSKLLTLTKNLMLVRLVHIAISTLAGLFLILHITYLFLPPSSSGMILGYISVAIAVVVWLSGTAFLGRLRDSLFFHGTMSSVLVALSLMHAAIASPNIPYVWSQVMLGATVIVAMGNATFHILRAISRA